MAEPETKKRRLETSSDGASNLAGSMGIAFQGWMEKIKEMEEEVKKEKAARQELESENNAIKNDTKNDIDALKRDVQRALEEKQEANHWANNHKRRVMELNAKNAELTDKINTMANNEKLHKESEFNRKTYWPLKAELKWDVWGDRYDWICPYCKSSLGLEKKKACEGCKMWKGEDVS